jgi:hypothetical protein
MPLSQHVHYDQFLTNLALEYKNAGFINNFLFPTMVVNKQTDRYKVYGNEAFALKETRRGQTDLANEVDFTWSLDNYYCEDHAIKTVIPWKQRQNDDQPQKTEQRSMFLIKSIVDLRKEVDAATVAFNQNNYDGDLVFNTNAADKWDVDTSDPLKMIEEVRNTMHQKSGLNPNTLVISRPVWSALRRHPKLLSIYKLSEMSIVPLATMKQWLEIDNIVVGEAVTAGKSGNGAKSYIWGKNAILAYVAPGFSDGMASYGASIEWTGYQTGTTAVRRYSSEERMADFIEYGHFYDFKILSNIAGALLPNIIA